MALTSFGRGRDGEGNDTAPSTRSTPPPAGPSGLTAFIDQGSEFEGKLSFRDTVRIDGRFQGEIASENTLIVGETGEIEATIRSNTVVVSGSVNGSIHAAKKVVLHKTAIITGDIDAPSVVIEEGAVLNGTLKMAGGKGAKSGSAPLKAIVGGNPPTEKPKVSSEQKS